ncbi:RND transporter [Luteitalea sp. TBR-22]|uniref:efflux RND transporter periplasmic adaptor subunit n=1 Tax=Luteitalea sp. TBR-22 TaxID=2802971 RepID=UPI001AF79ABF|nr:efflux RND transporter periplasmic adaptor subunit [Luteitalea sp. TBR-22]BCS32821.1 RND transporter [Luteitalea sp. TBR-22]
MRRRTLVIGALVLGLVAAAALVARRGPAGIEVDTAAVTRRPRLQAFVTASGEIVADRYADIGSSVMGRIDDLRVKEGDQVRAGQVLARLDPVQARSQRDAATAGVQALAAEQVAAREQARAARADIEAARARVAETEANQRRVEALFKERLVSAAERDTAQAAADGARAQLAAAQAAVARADESIRTAERRQQQARAQAAGAGDLLSKTEITSPIDGVVSRMQVRQGEMVVIGIQNQPGTTLMTISDLTDINAEIKVAEADVMRLKLGQPATVSLDAVPGRTFSGKVIEIGTGALPPPTGAAATAAAREFRVVVRITDADTGLRPGLTCDAEILTDERPNAIVVPLQAVVLRQLAGREDDATGVFVVKDGTARFVPVKTGIIGGLLIEVAGVEPGTEVVSGPFQVLRTLKDGDKVTAARK